jgi:hypothetical protein
MTATVVSLFQHSEADQSQAIRDARRVLHSPIRQEARDLRTACHVLQTWGDAFDYMMSRQMLLMLDRADLKDALPDPVIYPDQDTHPSTAFMLLTAACAGLLAALAIAAFQVLL